jgi:hypothetical protein
MLYLALFSGQQCYTFFFFIFITLQEKVDTVTVEGVENVREEDSITIKTEQHYVQLVRVIKTEQEVSVLFSK